MSFASVHIQIIEHLLAPFTANIVVGHHVSFIPGYNDTIIQNNPSALTQNSNY